MSSIPAFLATAIGSMPFTDPDKAAELSFEKLSAAPLWPQLPRLGLVEQMCPQYTEGMPRMIVNAEENRMYFDTTGDFSTELAEFYEAYLPAMDPEDGTGDCSALGISEDYAKGLYAFERLLKEKKADLDFVKVHATGPCSFALTMNDQDKRLIYHNEAFRDMIVKTIAMKCRWQIQKFQPFAKKVICFLDEPALTAYGTSTYVFLSRSDIVTTLAEVVDAIHQDNALAGIHCCGNTEWSILIDAGADIISFDAFEFGHTIALYPDAVKTLFERDGFLAWGVVPTSVAIRDQSPESLAEHLDKMIDNLSAKGIDKQVIIDHSVITPSCGTGSMEVGDAQAVFDIIAELPDVLRKRFGMQ